MNPNLTLKPLPLLARRQGLALWLWIAIFTSSAAPALMSETFAERLGWGARDVVVILHVDDAGMSHTSNLGAIEALEQGVASSCSVMMPCSWVSEMAHFLQKNPKIDAGLHLTLTAEWKGYRWGPLAGKLQVPGLVDDEGCLWPSVQEVAAHASPDEVDRELRAQIARAERLHIPITHLDSHMGTLFARQDYFERFARLGIEKNIPVLTVSSQGAHLSPDERASAAPLEPWLAKLWNAGLPALDDLYTGFTSLTGDKTERILALFQELKPGVTEILFHASRPSDEFPAVTASSAARGADLKVLTDPRVERAIRERGIILTTWRELHERRQKSGVSELPTPSGR